MSRSLSLSALALFAFACTPSGLQRDPEAVAGDQDRTVVGPDAANIVHTCDATLPTPDEGELCTVSGDPSTATHILIQGDILTDLAAFEQGGVLFENGVNGTITCTGCDCAEAAPADTLVVSCPDGVVSPGLVNAHDHLRYDLSDPAAHGSERYDHRHDWRKGKRGHRRLGGTRSDSSREGLLYNEIRMLLAGTTSVAGSVRGNTPDGLVRNLDTSASNGGLGFWEADYRTFPLGDSDGTMRSSSCTSYRIDSASRLESRVYLPHVAEGIDANARNEFRCLSGEASGSRDLIADNTSIVHGIGLTADDISLMAVEASELVWSPRSNISLYGETAPVALYRSLGVDIALGTDWTPSGSATMLRELQCADHLNQNHYGQLFSDRELWLMATANGARALGADGLLGRLRPGEIADLAIFDGSERSLYRAVLDAAVPDVELVLRGSEVLTGDTDLVQAMLPFDEAFACDALPSCLADHLLCVEGDTGKTLGEITSRVSGYDLVICDVPFDEPSCEPLRDEGDALSYPETDLTDVDGDGVEDGDDNCPTVFNPPLPLHGYQQGDEDLDGIGDVCDPCPLVVGESCSTWRDADGDGWLDADDNCPSVPNTDQADADGDFVGDACGGGTTPVPDCTDCADVLYDVKDGTLPLGSEVELVGVQVTAVGDGGFFVQVPEDHDDFRSADDAGIFVWLGSSPPVSRGDRVVLHGTSGDYFGQRQVSSVTLLDVLSSGHADPTPVVATAAELAGARSDDLEGVLVRVSGVMVTATDLPPGPGESAPTGAFELAGALRVDDWLYGASPDVGDTFASVSGVLRWANGSTRIEPRDADDLQDQAVASVFSLGPATLDLEVGALGSLQIDLLSAVPFDALVDVACDPELACPSSVTVPAGDTSATFTVEALAAGSAEILVGVAGEVPLVSTVTVTEPVVQPPPPSGAGLLITRYFEGSSGNNKAIQLTNEGASPVDLSTCAIELYTNGNTSGSTIALSGSLPAGADFLACHGSFSFSTGAPCDLSGNLSFNGDDALALVCGGTVLDVVGRIGEDPGSAWGTTLSTANSGLTRACGIVVGDPDGADVFDPAAEWTAFPGDDASLLGLARSCP